MIQRILCPTDLTAASKFGVRYAFSLARRNGGRLTLFNGISFPRPWQCPGEFEAYYDWQHVLAKFATERLLAEGERRVKQFVCKNFSLESIDVPWSIRVVLLGRLADDIIMAAFQEEADLIVMERGRSSWLARIQTASTLESVSRAAPCPVLSIDGSAPHSGSSEWSLPLLKQLPSY